ncbi:MAG: hypothetical protein WD008_02865 [Balneolaceae bacterium]
MRTFKTKYHLSALLAVFIIWTTGGCASYNLDRAQHQLRTNYSSANYQSAAEHLEKMESNEVYKTKDAVLLHLEKGLVYHFSGNYMESNQSFETAELEIDANFTKSLSRGFKSVLLNDNALAYDGEDYEDVYINLFRALNYIHLDNYDAALVEGRKLAFKLENIEIRNRGLAETISRDDSLNTVNWQTGDHVVENSAMGHFLSAVLFAKTGRQDNARIEIERMNRAFSDQIKAFDFTPLPPQALTQINEPQSYNVLITGFSGRSPVKNQNDVRFFMDEMDTYLKFSVPSLQMYPSSVNYIETVVGDSISYPLYLIEEMDQVARDVYKVKEPMIYARALTRSAAKAAGVNKISNEISEKNENLGFIAKLLGIIGQEVSEKADLRSWQTLPGKAYGNLIRLPPGTHTIRMNYYSHNHNILYSEDHTIEVFEGNDLALIETLYWY